MLLSSP